MKTTTTIVLLFGISFLIFSCGEKKQTEQNSLQTEQTESHPIKRQLSLDNGKRWKTNPETNLGVNIMIMITDNFTDRDNNAAYTELKENLDAEFDLIFKNCTMTGEAHDQLHNYLFPIKQKLSSFISDDTIIQKENLEHLKILLAEYSNYFE